MATVLVQAGHEGGLRNQGSGSVPSLGASGVSIPERELTPVVADEAAYLLRKAGVTVIREDAFLDQHYTVDLGVFLHFDGSGSPCASGASMGYPTGGGHVEAWRDFYYSSFPFKTMADNFTSGLRGYYGYSWVTGPRLLIEFGEISCPEQDAWLQPKLPWLAAMVAHWAAGQVGVTIPDPGEPEVYMATLESLEQRIAALEAVCTPGDPTTLPTWAAKYWPAFEALWSSPPKPNAAPKWYQIAFVYDKIVKLINAGTVSPHGHAFSGTTEEAS